MGTVSCIPTVFIICKLYKHIYILQLNLWLVCTSFPGKSSEGIDVRCLKAFRILYVPFLPLQRYGTYGISCEQ